MDLKTRLEIGGEGLLAMLDADKEFMPTNGWEVAHDLGRWWDAALRLEETILGSWGQVPHTEDSSHTKPMRGEWFDGTATSGRALEAVIWLFESTGEPSVLDLARRLAEHHLDYSTNREGTVRAEIVDPNNVGHNHSYHGTLRGLLLFGLLTGEKVYVDVVEATYRNGVRNQIVRESGWAPHDLGKLRYPNVHGDPVTDPASAGDSAQLALWLALHAGCDDLLDDVERLVRARILPAQMMDEDMQSHSERTFAPRERGAWCIHEPSHAGKGCTPDVHAAVIHTLCDIHSHILTHTATGVRVNLHFDAENEVVKTISKRGQEARITVIVKHPDNVLIRIPGWVPKPSIRLAIDGETCPVQRSGVFALIPSDVLKIGSEIRLSYDLPQRSTQEEMLSGRCYRFRWKGDEIVGITPQEDGMPFYPSMP